jgi:lipid II:glycine glycyltransferase (peptidoglycan interpeptide bridge formation enzyme)
MGDNIEIRLARKHGVPIAAILTLKHRASVIYKYGCSNDKFRHLGAMPFLFWRLIEDSKTLGLETIDFGRSELDNNGLITFKDRFGATRKLLTYYRYSVAEKDGITTEWGLRAMRQIFSVLPDAVLSMAGRVLYRHIG